MIKTPLFYLLFFMCYLAYPQLVINEYSAANYDSYQDNYGEYEDWFEIYNTTGSPIDISGYYLSDKENNLVKWQVPSSFIVPAGGVILVFCSGRDEVSGGFAHTNFKITQTKGNEVLIISDPLSNVLDSISVRPNIKTHSRGRETNGSGTWSVFSTPTPGSPNSGALQEYASTPIFSIPSGYYSGSAQVIITSPDPNVTIYYTVDGTAPETISL